MAERKRPTPALGGLADVLKAKREREEKARERERLADARMKAAVERYGKRLGQIAVEAGLGDVKIPVDVLKREFQAIAERFRGSGEAVATGGGATGAPAREAGEG